MSTFSGLASKGEKGKSKYQSLDINSYFRSSRGESLEKQQQKSAVPLKHGMQTLGRVPARRGPVNLPSLKSEHSGSDAAVSLVPAGGPGWGKQDATSTSTTTTTTPSSTTSATSLSTNTSSVVTAPQQQQQHQQPQQQQQQQQLTPHQAAIAIPVTNTVPAKHTATGVEGSGGKSWSSVMTGPTDLLHPPPYQSPQFQHEFPSLSSGDGATITGTHTTAGNTTEIQYGPGPSLRPQTEGSWIQGGSRPVATSGSDGPLRNNNSGPLAAPPQLPVQVGQQPLPPQFRGVMPPFMYRNNFAPNGPVPPTGPPASMNGRGRLDSRPPSRHVDSEEVTHRPIIKEEDLSKMDDISRDVGWASHDDIDYNQKLAFSDDESPSERDNRKTSSDRESQNKSESGYTQETHSRASWSRGSSRGGGRLGEEDEGLVRRRQQHSEEVAIAVERAKQRKEEEEKRFLESRQAAAKKLQELNEKLKGKRDKDADETQGTINPSVVPPQPITPAPIPVPDWEKEKEVRPRSPNESSEEKNQQHSSLDFKQLTKIEGNRSNYSRSAERVSRERDQNGPNYNNRHFQSDLPPRFQKQRQNNTPSPASFQYENRWPTHGSVNPPKKIEEKERDEERKDYRRQGSEESYKSQSHRTFSESSNRDSEHEGKRDRELQLKVEHEDWHGDRREKYRDDRPQRPDSRDSRVSRDSRQSEPRDYSSWADAPYEPAYEEKKKDSHRDDRRQVPGPITKERIEADDLKTCEKRNLTQLKRGQLPDKKISDTRKDDKATKEDDSWCIKKQASDSSIASKSWSDTASTTMSQTESQKLFDALEKPTKSYTASIESVKEDTKLDDDEKKGGAKEKRGPSSRNRSDRSQWGAGYSSNRTFSRRGQGRGGRGPGGPLKLSSGKSGDIIGTDSEGSMEEVSSVDDKGIKTKKVEKDEKNKEIKGDKSPIPDKRSERQDKRDSYVPRGEPSRLGRGGYNVRRGGISKKIDGYGPPPSKSPFGNAEEKKLTDETSADADKQNQNTRKESQSVRKPDDRNKSRKQNDSRRGKPRGKDDLGEGYSDNSEDGEFRGGRKWSGSNRTGQSSRRNAPPSRSYNEKRGNFNSESAGVQKSDEKGSETDLKKENHEEEHGETEIEDKHPDSDGFQEVKNKKTGKEKLKGSDDKVSLVKSVCKFEKDIVKSDRKSSKSNGSGNSSQLTQHISNIPPLMGTPIHPPGPLGSSANKIRYERPRQNCLPPRLMKQKENNRIKAQMQNICESGDINKVGQNMGMYGVKDSIPISNAWDKPLTGQLRGNLEQDVMNVAMENCKGLDQVQSPSQSNSPNTEKAKGEKLDGATPPVNTIIFENTNFKATPGCRSGRNDKSRKLEDSLDSNVMSFNKPITDLLNKSEKQESMQIGLTFSSKEDNADMKLDFFESEISHLTEDKSSKNLTAALNYKIQSVKKVWETSMPTVIEHNVGQDDSNTSFSSSFGPDPKSLDPSGAFSKSTDTPDDSNDGYNTAPNQVAANSTTNNVCMNSKQVKPTQQVASTVGQTVLNTGSHQQHSSIVGPGLMGHPLSPPPMQPVLGGGVGLGQPPQQYTTNQHIGYQPSLGGNTQFGVSAIPSPPTVLFNSTQPLQAAQTPSMYSHFSLEQAAGVIGGQGRSQYSQYAYNHLGQAAGSGHYNAQSTMYLQTAPQPHPPPGAGQAPPDIYSGMNSYRLSAAAPFGQNQQLNNPTTVLISSTSNSLMSPSVKPSSQQISAIGTKAGGVGQAYPQQSQQGQQLYMAYDATIQANYLPNTGVLQRGPAGPVQNSVVPTMQPSTSFYSGSTGGQTGYFQQPGSSAQLPQHQAGYGLQGNVFGTHNQSHTSGGIQGFNSHFLTSPMQLAAAAALNAQQQQFRSQNLQNAAYLKNQGIGDQTGRPQQLKSPGTGQQEVLSSVFNSTPQIPSPKSRQNNKPPPPQPSPTSQHKYNLYQGMSNQQGAQTQRYPAPIQRPVNFQPLASLQNSSNQKHRSNNQSNNKVPPRQYYSNQGSNLSAQNEKNEELKLTGSTVANVTTSNIVTSSSSTTTKTNVSTAAVNQSQDVVKETAKEETAVLKD